MEEERDKIANDKDQNQSLTGFVSQIALILQREPEGAKLVQTSSLFMGEARALWSEKFSKHGIDYVLDNLEVSVKAKDAKGNDIIIK
jgi:hypothetical protein